MYNAAMYIRIYNKYKLYICMCVYRLADYFAAFVVNFVIDVRCTRPYCNMIIYLLLLLYVVLKLLEVEESRIFFVHKIT